MYIYNALAFSTLLSSQETDAHRRGACRSTSGQPLNLTLVFPPCQPRFSGSFREVSKRATDPPDTRAHRPRSADAATGTREPWKKVPDGSPGPGPPSGVPSPSGQEELYGWRAAQSNRELYPVGIPVLTCPNKFRCWRDPARLVMPMGPSPVLAVPRVS